MLHRIALAALAVTCLSGCVVLKQFETRVTQTGVLYTGHYILFDDEAALVASDFHRCTALAVPQVLRVKADQLDHRRVRVVGPLAHAWSGEVDAGPGYTWADVRYQGQQLQDWCFGKMIMVRSLEPVE